MKFFDLVYQFLFFGKINLYVISLLFMEILSLIRYLFGNMYTNLSYFNDNGKSKFFMVVFMTVVFIVFNFFLQNHYVNGLTLFY